MSTVDYDLLAVPETTRDTIASLHNNVVQQNEQWTKRQVAVFDQETTRRPSDAPVVHVTLAGKRNVVKHHHTSQKYETALLFGMCLATGFIVWKLVYGDGGVR